MLNNIILIFVNVLIFILMQTIFFYFVGSRQLEKVINDKVDIVNQYMKYDSSYKSKIKEYMNTEKIKNIINKAEDEEKERTQENIEIIKKWIGTPLIVLVSLLLICFIIFIIAKKKWTGIDNVGLSLVFTAYLTEICIFFGIIQKYIFLGDQTLYYFLYNLIKKELNKLVN